MCRVLKEDETMKWTFEDAVNLAVSMFRNNEIGFNDLDRTAAELWQEMQNENESDQSTN